MTRQGYTDPQALADLNRVSRGYRPATASADDVREACAVALCATELSLSAWEVAAAVQQPIPRVMYALHRLQDCDRVLMRNGWYRASESERRRHQRADALTELARLGQDWDKSE